MYKSWWPKLKDWWSRMQAIHPLTRWTAHQAGWAVPFGTGVAMAEWDEFGWAIAAFIVAALALFFKAIHWKGLEGRPRVTVLLRTCLMLGAIVFGVFMWKLTVSKKGDKPWTAFHFHKSPPIGPSSTVVASPPPSAAPTPNEIAKQSPRPRPKKAQEHKTDPIAILADKLKDGKGNRVIIEAVVGNNVGAQAFKDRIAWAFGAAQWNVDPPRNYTVMFPEPGSVQASNPDAAMICTADSLNSEHVVVARAAFEAIHIKCLWSPEKGSPLRILVRAEQHI